VVSTINLGEHAAGLDVTVQRGADKTLVLRLTNVVDGSTVNVSADHSAVLTLDGVPYSASNETVGSAPALVWRFAKAVTAAFKPGERPARLSVTNVESGVQSDIGIGSVTVE